MSKEKKITVIIIACVIIILFPVMVLAEGIETYTISFNSMGGSAVADITAQSGSVIGKPEDPINPGHIFTGWYKEEECVNEWNFDTDTVTSDITLFAGWKDLFYTISATSNDASMGVVSGGGEYASEVSVTLSATPYEGFRFVRWAESGSKDPVCRLTVSADTQVTAEFAPIDTPSLTAVPSGYNSVALSWAPLEYASGYEVYRSDKRDGEYSLIYTAPTYDSISFIDKGLETDKTYYYKIRVICVCDTAVTYGNFSQPVSAMPRVKAPSAAASGGGYRCVRVSWNKVPGATGYEIYRSAAQDESYSKVSTLNFSEAYGYTDYNLNINETYYYKVRAYRSSNGKKYYSDYSGIQRAAVSLTAPVLNAVSASESSVRLTWNALQGVIGYELFRSITPNGKYEKIYTSTSASEVIYTDKRLKKGIAHYYKIRAYGKQGSKKIYSEYSQEVSAVPLNALEERSFTILYQGDPKWGFSTSVRKRACLMCAYVITISNMGIDVTPKTLYKANGNSTNITSSFLAKKFGVKPVCAVDLSSPYLRSYSGFGTYIKNPSANAANAIKEALNKHPDGVICYFKRGGKAHAIVACKYDGNTIYYSDPGRTRTTLLTFNNTWVRYSHRMSYGNLSYIVALEKIKEP